MTQVRLSVYYPRGEDEQKPRGEDEQKPRGQK